ncbi:MAG: InlB B-repeat-containing protein, partial [Spirochaetes bacterium]|nr:InlB B-repeat-containing protein [Spirochaetota bacterium]
MKTSSLFLIFFIIFTLCACENPWMKKVIEIKIITFNSNGGTSVSDQILLKSERVRRPQDPTKYGFRFAGWYTDNETFMFPYNFDFVPLEDMTLHANWIENFFQSVDDVREFLNNQQSNTSDRPYYVKLNIGN